MSTDYPYISQSQHRIPSFCQSIDNDSSAATSGILNSKTASSSLAEKLSSNTERIHKHLLGQQGDQNNNNNHYASAQLFKTLFGAEISSWPYSESSLNQALVLRISQEKTKQEFYKVEQLNRIVEILKLATMAKVPGHLIPSLLDTKFGQSSSSSSISTSVDRNILLQTPPQSSGFSPSNSPSPTKANPPNHHHHHHHHHHSRSKTISSLSELESNITLNLNTNTQQQHTEFNNMKNSINSVKHFKFGLGPNRSSNGIQKKRTLLPPKHQLSPSRIGAHAISSSSLNRHSNTNNKNSFNLMNFRHGTNHKRTLSLPATVSIPEFKQMNFHKIDDETNDDNAYNNQLNIPNLQYNHNHNHIVENNIDIDVDKLLNGTSTELKESLKLKKLSGSPLKEMVTITEDSINNHDNNNTLLNLSEDSDNLSKFNSSSTPKKILVFEPKTP